MSEESHAFQDMLHFQSSCWEGQWCNDVQCDFFTCGYMVRIAALQEQLFPTQRVCYMHHY